MGPESIQSLFANILGCLTLLFYATPSGFNAAAQNSRVSSGRPLVSRFFDPDKSETVTLAFLFDLYADPSRPAPRVSLHRVEYRYPGKTQARPEVISFVFMPLNKYKNAPNFSVTVDGQVIQEGPATFADLCCSEVNGRKETQQQIIVSLPTDVFERVTQAKKVELKLTSKSGNHSFKLNDDQKKRLVALAETIK